MHQIDNPWAVTAKPIAQPVGSPGWFQKGAPPDLLATIVDFDWANTIQAEILNVVLAGGLVPDKQNDSQLLQAIHAMIEGVTGVNLDMFVLKAGDTMTGPLITPKLTSNTGRIISQTASQPSVTLADAAHGAGMWIDPNGTIYLGQADGNGNSIAAWIGANAGGLTSFGALTGTTTVVSLNGRIISHGPSYPSVTVYDTTRGVAWGMWSDPSSNLGWGSADGNGGAIGQLMWLTPAGQLNVNTIAASGTINAAAIGASGSINGAQIMSSGPIYASYPLAPAFYLNGDGSQNVLNFQGGYAFIWRTSDGMLSYVANNGTAMTIDYTGFMAIAGNITVHQAVSFSGAQGTNGPGNLFCTPDHAAFRFMGTYPQYQQLGINGWGAVLSYNTQSYPDGGGAWCCDINGNTTQAGACIATAYPGPSDASLKTNSAAWTPGLAVVLQINPISYEFTEESKLGPPGVPHYGVTAQDVQAVLPEAVVPMKRYLTNDPNEVPTEVLAVEANTIFYACLNAIKEIAGRLDVLEGARA
jgi:hypothetical protein